MTNISALDILKAAVSASDILTKQPASDAHTDYADFSSYLKTDKNLEDIFAEAAQTYGVSVELLKAMAKQESNFNPNAVSKAGAIGVMQLMPATAAGLGVTNAYDPYQNVMGGAKYIRQMLDKYNGNVSLALAAYNAGSNNVDKYGGIPPFAETQDYVAKITGYLQQGVTVPDNSATYTAQSAVNGDRSVTYQDLNQLAGDILTEIFSYDDYMKYLSSLLGIQEERQTLSLSVSSVSSDPEENGEETDMQPKEAVFEPSVPESYLAYQDLTSVPAPGSLTITSTQNEA